LNWVDIVIAIPVLLGTYCGYQRGILSQMTSWFSWILGFYSGGELSKFIAPFLEKTAVVNSSYLSIVSFLLSFLLIFWVVRLLNILLARAMYLTWAYSINRFFGALLGLLKSFLYIPLGVFLFSHLNNSLDLIASAPLNNSILFQKVLSLNSFLYDKISQSFSSIKNIKHIL